MGAFFARHLNIAWLTAFDGVFDDEDAHALLVTPSDAVLPPTPLQRGSARGGCPRRCGRGRRRTGHPREVRRRNLRRPHADRRRSRPKPSRSASRTMSLAGFRALEAAFAEVPERPKLRETSDFIVNLRAVKDVQEIARMKAFQAVTDAAFAHIGYMRPGMTEREVQIELEDFMRRHGAEALRSRPS
ncbi:MAG: M24 family metallopeptidase [Eggerthella lenta]